MRKEDISKLSWFRTPHLVLYYFGLVILELCSNFLRYVVEHWIISGAVGILGALLYLLITVPPADLVPLRDVIVTEGSFITYWVVLGILSSVGLGSGLHTFVLFLGPHILRIATTAVELNSTAFSARIEGYFTWPENWDVSGLSSAFSPRYSSDAWSLVNGKDSKIPDVFSIYLMIAWPAFLWGLGTSLGELPPYFIARAAARAGEALEELEEIENIEIAMHDEKLTLAEKSSSSGKISASSEGNAKKPSLSSRAKLGVYAAIQKYGFFAILLAASIPNPLFDLAGITCGHFGVSFWTFFGATFLGKAIAKVSIQSIFIIAVVVLGPRIHEFLISNLPTQLSTYLISKILHGVNQYSDELIEATPSLSVPVKQSNSGILKTIWGYVLMGMILYFIQSTIMSLVQEYVSRLASEQQNQSLKKNPLSPAPISSLSPRGQSTQISSDSFATRTPLPQRSAASASNALELHDQFYNTLKDFPPLPYDPQQAHNPAHIHAHSLSSLLVNSNELFGTNGASTPSKRRAASRTPSRPVRTPSSVSRKKETPRSSRSTTKSKKSVKYESGEESSDEFEGIGVNLAEKFKTLARNRAGSRLKAKTTSSRNSSVSKKTSKNSSKPRSSSKSRV